LSKVSQYNFSLIGTMCKSLIVIKLFSIRLWQFAHNKTHFFASSKYAWRLRVVDPFPIPNVLVSGIIWWKSYITGLSCSPQQAHCWPNAVTNAVFTRFLKATVGCSFLRLALILQPQEVVLPSTKWQVWTSVCFPQSHWQSQYVFLFRLGNFYIATNFPNRCPVKSNAFGI